MEGGVGWDGELQCLVEIPGTVWVREAATGPYTTLLGEGEANEQSHVNQLDWVWLTSRNPLYRKADLAIYSYFVCVKRSVAVIYPSLKMDSADKANFIGSITQTINAMRLTLKYAPNSGYVHVTTGILVLIRIYKKQNYWR